MRCEAGVGACISSQCMIVHFVEVISRVKAILSINSEGILVDKNDLLKLDKVVPMF
jgi:hypothetical protein